MATRSVAGHTPNVPMHAASGRLAAAGARDAHVQVSRRHEVRGFLQGTSRAWYSLPRGQHEAAGQGDAAHLAQHARWVAVRCSTCQHYVRHAVDEK